jgi:hypothetical protein
MTKLGITVGILATVLCLPAETETIGVNDTGPGWGADRAASGEAKRATAERAVSNRSG